MRQEKGGKGKKGRLKRGGKLTREGMERKGRMGGENVRMGREQKERGEWKGRTGTGENGNRGECLEGRSERIRKVGTERKFDNRIKKG